MAVSSDYLAYVLDQLAELGEVSARRMFGAAGLYSGELFFAIVADDVLYLRVDDSNRADFSSRGMAQFRPYADRPLLSMNYYEVPADVLENAGELAAWARRSVAVAMRAPQPAATRARGRKRRPRPSTRQPRAQRKR